TMKVQTCIVTRVTEENGPQGPLRPPYGQDGHVVIDRTIGIRSIPNSTVRLRLATIHCKTAARMSPLHFRRSQITDGGANHLDHLLLQYCNVVPDLLLSLRRHTVETILRARM